MILKEVVLHNFGPFRGRTVIDMAPVAPLGQRPVVLFGALNGSGKTSLLDALLLALYGGRARCSSRGTLSYQDFLRECINNRTPVAEGASVSVTFDHITTRTHAELRIERSWKVAGQRVVEQCQVFQNGKQDVELTETWAERVEGIIPLGISNLFFFDGEQVRTIASSREPSEEVKGAIRTLLGIELPDQLRIDLQVIATRKRKGLMAEPIMRAKMEEQEQELKKAIAERSALATDMGELHNRLETAKRKLAKQSEDFTSKGGKAAENRKELEHRLQEAQGHLKVARSRLQELAAGAMPLTLMLPLLKRTQHSATEELKSVDAQALAPALESYSQELLQAFMGQKAEPEAVALLQNVIVEFNRRRVVKDKARIFRASNSDLTIVERQIKDAMSQVGTAEVILREIADHEEICRRMEAQLLVAAPTESLERGLKALAEAQQIVGDLSTKYTQMMSKHSEAQQRAGRLEREVQRLQAEVKLDSSAVNEDARIVRAADRVSSVMAEYQQRLLLRRVHELERHIGERFRYLHRKEGMVHQVRLDVNTFQLSLFDDEGLVVNRERMSAGEQQLLAVAFLWGLSIASGRRLPVVIDTPLGRMDHTHRRHIVERYFPAASHQVILLSTDAEVDERYHKLLVDIGCIDREYLMQYDQEKRGTTVHQGYFWSA